MRAVLSQGKNVSLENRKDDNQGFTYVITVTLADEVGYPHRAMP